MRAGEAERRSARASGDRAREQHDKLARGREHRVHGHQHEHRINAVHDDLVGDRTREAGNHGAPMVISARERPMRARPRRPTVPQCSRPTCLRTRDTHRVSRLRPLRVQRASLLSSPSALSRTRKTASLRPLESLNILSTFSAGQYRRWPVRELGCSVGGVEAFLFACRPSPPTRIGAPTAERTPTSPATAAAIGPGNSA